MMLLACETQAHLEEVPEQVVALVLAGHKHEHLATLVPVTQNLQQPQKSAHTPTPILRTSLLWL